MIMDHKLLSVCPPPSPTPQSCHQWKENGFLNQKVPGITCWVNFSKLLHSSEPQFSYLKEKKKKSRGGRVWGGEIISLGSKAFQKMKHSRVCKASRTGESPCTCELPFLFSFLLPKWKGSRQEKENSGDQQEGNGYKSKGMEKWKRMAQIWGPKGKKGGDCW